ncbi:winged helix-turn-helix transcriptional regulator [Limosilactobacillus agrestis]|uniref:Winged helix-turn-helix transcriptional regulator n=1 Tax=Limosilactobacillus agrestis TaxID=2759748 RepID=A0A7W3YLI6_9LACO|nr:winged helix-turn-helix transcriptional regulator [Limosilactobacillus agrestis]MBB1095506.1 winged helix-turn-helix transcriptional regulator [Limosilactobacillus agrestis]MBB1098753.1 winged helix-turn-helix transcriptional regulator [Limosilactobacillus agrestis]MCD7113620.1 winged helix-turn-helix transcriptional regulator [Limosilactobacillus agrestis]MCD7120055.1 winged helix-turn-helix transcriptional regulator [Limosilactobacillus agrestis]MCD7125718.1 winged helix-turn-helix transc
MAEEIYQLAVDITLKTISGKWKTSILCNLGTAPMRTGELKRRLPGISQRILTKQLKELETDQIIKRKVYPEVPPRVEYCLTEHGKTLRKILLEMSEWGSEHAELQNASGHNYEIIDQNLKGFQDMS